MKALAHQHLAALAGSFLIFAAAAPACAQGLLKTITVESRSKQFVVTAAPGSPSPGRLSEKKGWVQLEPASLAISCERIREDFFFRLNLSDRGFLNRQNFAGRVFVVIHHDPDQPVSVTALSNSTDWNYRLDLSDRVETQKLIEAVVQILISELANRDSRQAAHAAPFWLARGLSGIVQQDIGASISLPANQPVTLLRAGNPVETAQRRFLNVTPLTFEELSWPENLDPEKFDRFADSAEIFVHQLLQLKNGPAELRQAIANLSSFENWQFAFLNAFRAEFGQLIDVEKWWTLRLVQITGREPSQFWSRAESWSKLENALAIPVQVHLIRGSLPTHAQDTLQEVVENWDALRQEMVLRRAATQLAAMRFRLPTDLVNLADGYRAVLENYLEQRTLAGASRSKGSQINLTVLRRASRRQLDLLDEKRFALRQKPVDARDEAVASALSVSQPGAGKKN